MNTELMTLAEVADDIDAMCVCRHCDEWVAAIRARIEPAQPVEAVGGLAATTFICHLIDNHEGEKVTEESLQSWLAEAVAHPRPAGDDLATAARGLLADYEEDHGEGACDCMPEPENAGHICNACLLRAALAHPRSNSNRKDRMVVAHALDGLKNRLFDANALDKDGWALHSSGADALLRIADPRHTPLEIPDSSATGSVLAWVTPEGDRSITAMQKIQMTRDGGASASSVKPFLIPAYDHPRRTGDGMVSVLAEDANNYCLILTVLGMEEEGDPLAEVERLMEVANTATTVEQAGDVVPYTAEVVAEVVRGDDGEKKLSFVIEGAAEALEVGDVLYTIGGLTMPDDGAVEMYLSQPRPSTTEDSSAVAQPRVEQAGEVVRDRHMGVLQQYLIHLNSQNPTQGTRPRMSDVRAALKAVLAQPRPVGGPDGPLTGKYADVLVPFVALMERELHANAGKGDRDGWLAMTPQVAMLEIHHHVAKLQKAALNGDITGVCEYAADVANMSMMAVDVCGALIDVEPAPAKAGGA